MKFQYFNGIKFTRDNKTGYYLYSTKRIRIHRYVWQYYNGVIPPVHDIHHKDGDKANNDISNLELIHKAEHQRLHSKEYHRLNRKKALKHLDNIRDMTKEWHASADGKEWHKQHYLKMKDKLYVTKKMKCAFCSVEFEGFPNHSRVCSNRCKSALRRLEGKDNITNVCVICGSQFTVNKYRKQVVCSIRCGYANRKNKID